jgi:hypothetical protein
MICKKEWMLKQNKHQLTRKNFRSDVVRLSIARSLLLIFHAGAEETDRNIITAS